MIRKFLSSLVLLTAALLLIPYVALAQDTDSVVRLDPLIAEITPYLLALLSAVATAAIALVTKKFNDWTGITIEANHRDALQSALMNGARAVLAKYTPRDVAVDVKSVPLKEGVQFVLESVPDAVAYFGLTPAEIEQHLTPKLVSLMGGK